LKLIAGVVLFQFQEGMMMERLRIGIIGAGRIGKIHAVNIAHFIPQAELAGIADIKLDPAGEAWAKKLGCGYTSKDPGELLHDPAIHAIAICSSTNTHADLVIAASEAGKHIFCEKPIDLTLVKAKAAILAAKKAGVKLQIGFNRRFDHNFTRVREHVLSGGIGQVHLVKITSRDPAPPSPAYVAGSGGIFLDMMIHDFDMARFQAGSEITEVFAIGEVLIDPEIGKAGDVDTAIVTLKFASGAMGVIDNSRKAVYGYDQRLEVFGSGGAAIAENDHHNRVKLWDDKGITGDKPEYFFLERYKGTFVNEVAAFVDAVQNKKPVPVSGEDGLENMYVALAAGKSLMEGRPVEIAEIKQKLS